MLLQLIRKDFVIVRKYVWLMFGVVLLIPPFILWRIPEELTGSISFAISAVFAVILLLMYVSLKEFQYTKATALLCAAPIPRRLIVLAKYGFCLTVFAASTLIYGLETLLFPQLGELNIKMLMGTFVGIFLLVSVYLPIQFKFGYEKSKFFFMLVIMLSPFLLPQLIKSIQIPQWVDIRSTPVLLTGVTLGVMMITLSVLISMTIFNKKDLV
jgi:hypothetical protein